MVKRALMIAYHYPPYSGGSGIHRTLKFSRYLPGLGWQPIILTTHTRAYASTSDDQLNEIPPEAIVHRAFSLDTSRHLSIRGSYLRLLALPDRWISWWIGAVPAGLRLIRKHRPDVIWSTYPIATAHLIGLSLHRLTGIPWVADLRDPMTDPYYPTNALTRRVFQWIERKTIAHCTKAVCTTRGTIKLYQDRYPDIPASRFSLIENGYDEENFASAADITRTESDNRPFVLLHSGVVYPSERDPTQLFQALAKLLRRGDISGNRLRLVFRASAHEDYLAGLIEQHAIGSIVSLAPPLSHCGALSEMLTADGLLILQASNCNNQIPAKLYEYLRAQRPIFALTDPTGDTAEALTKAGIDTIAALDSEDEIVRALLRFLALAEGNEAPIAPMDKALGNSRKARSRELANLFDGVLGGHC